MSRAKNLSPKALAHRRAAVQSAGRSGAVIKSRNPRFPDLVPDRPLKRDHSPQPWPLNESDLDLCEQSPPSPTHPREGGGGNYALAGSHSPSPLAGEGRDGGSMTPMPSIHFLGCLTAAERGVQGNVTLDVLLHTDGSCEVGPFVFPRPQVTQLLKLVMAADVLREAWA